jgi:hypothetical protein
MRFFLIFLHELNTFGRKEFFGGNANWPRYSKFIYFPVDSVCPKIISP